MREWQLPEGYVPGRKSRPASQSGSGSQSLRGTDFLGGLTRSGLLLFREQQGRGVVP